MKIESTKANMQQIFRILEVVEKYNETKENWKCIKKELEWSDSIFWHVVCACATLHLITRQSGKGMQLTYDGKSVLDAHLTGKETARDVFGKVLLFWDSKEYKIAQAFFDSYEVLGAGPGQIVTLQDLRSSLSKLDVTVTDGVLKGLLSNFYRFADLVGIEGARLRFNIKRYQELKKLKLYLEPHEIPNELFLKYLLKAYRELSKDQGMKYVSIPSVKNFVCKKKELNIPEFVFDEKLANFPSDFRGKRVILAPPRGPRAGGINRGKDYFYYLAIFEGGSEENEQL